MKPLVERLRGSLAEEHYNGTIRCAALVERLNLERQEAADLIEELQARAAREDGRSERQHGYVPDSLPDRT